MMSISWDTTAMTWINHGLALDLIYLMIYICIYIHVIFLKPVTLGLILLLLRQYTISSVLHNCHACDNEFGNLIDGKLPNQTFLYGFMEPNRNPVSVQDKLCYRKMSRISKPCDLYIFWSFWNLACRSANFRAVWYLKTQSHDFKCYEGELSYAVMYVWMLNVSMNINWSKLWLHVISCNISPARYAAWN